MVNRTVTGRRIVIAATLWLLALPLVAVSAEKKLGQDWYCPDHEGHAGYVQHLKLHLDHESDAIADKLGEIYADPSLSTEQKRAKAIGILKKHLAKEDVGPGVGD